ncbi:MAG: exodeoxyribonuclease III [Anaerolineae bacterium]|nr:exodeoxyribonuclease III [Anaerolineae bacterium]
MTPLKLISWNVNGLRAAYGKGFVEWARGAQPDILCLQETKASKEQLPEDLQDFDGYHAVFSAAEKKGYSGVATYSRVAPQSVETDIGVARFDREGRVIISHYRDFTLLNVYFPNGKASDERLQYKMDFYAVFLDYVNRLREAGKSIVLCGDVNTAHKPIDLARPGPNETVSGFLPQERAWMDDLVAAGYVDTFRMFDDAPEQYTWWSFRAGARERNVGWRIDYFFVSEDIKDRVAAAHIWPDVMGSDHCPIGIEIDLSM